MKSGVKILDHGYVRLIETYGNDQSIIEAARMSTNKGFKGWGGTCHECHGTGESMDDVGVITCPTCNGEKILPEGDERLLSFLYNNKHMTPFEMGGMIIEVKAPIMVFREWHRHRTQSYNEMSARYTPLPDENYEPSLQRIKDGAAATSNKQAQGTATLACDEEVARWLNNLHYLYKQIEAVYQNGLAIGIPKELARLPVPVARYSRMRANANLRNWLAFMTLRMAPNAQWEIRQYANAVSDLIEMHFPRTHALYMAEFEGKHHG